MKTLIMKLLGAQLNLLSIINPKKAGELGMNLFAHPVRQTVTEKHRAFLDASHKSTLEFHNLKIQTYRWGHGPKKILFLHGWQSHSYRWKKYIDFFDKDEYTVFALDAPGHGLSTGNFLHVPLYAEIVKAFVAREGVMDAVITHSMGSFASLYAFYMFPAIVPKMLITLAAPGEATEFLQHFRKALSLSERTSRILVKRFREVFKATLEDFSAPVFASTLHIPGLIIHDELDADTSVYHSRRINEAWKNSTFVVTKGLGHNLRSHEIVERVVHFVNDTIHQTQSI